MQTRKHRVKFPRKKKIVIGKIYADWCFHCISLKPEWDKMKEQIKLDMGRKFKNVHIEFREIGDTDENKSIGKTVDLMINKFNSKHMSKSTEKLALDGGYPTIFKLCDGKLDYYRGDRVTDAMYKWAISGCSNIVGGAASKKKVMRKTTKRWFW